MSATSPIPTAPRRGQPCLCPGQPRSVRYRPVQSRIRGRRQAAPRHRRLKPLAMAAIDMDRVAVAIAEVAATEVMPRFMKLAAGDIREKAPGDVVTIADGAAEAALAPRLQALRFGSVMLGEEAAAADPGLIERLSAEAPVWVVDPV